MHPIGWRQAKGGTRWKGNRLLRFLAGEIDCTCCLCCAKGSCISHRLIPMMTPFAWVMMPLAVQLSGQRATCNGQRPTCNDLKSLLEAFNACCSNCNRCSASLLPTNSLASFAWFSVCNEMRNLLPVCSCLFAVPLAHLPLPTSFCLPLSSFFPHHRSSYCRLHCNCNCRTQHSVPRSQFNILSLFSFCLCSLSLSVSVPLWHQRNWFVSLAICRLLVVQIDWNWV